MNKYGSMNMVTSVSVADPIEISRWDQFVYHYTSLSPLLEHILPNRELRMSPFSQVNDPKESKEKSVGIVYIGEEAATFASKKASFKYDSRTRKKANILLNNYCKVICFSSDNINVLDYDNYRRAFYRGYSRPRMWAQYGDNHKGVCLVFDKEILSKQIHKAFGVKNAILENHVEYSDDLSIVNEALSLRYDLIVEESNLQEYLFKKHFHEYEKELFFYKALDWRDEVEFRWVLISTKQGYQYFSFGDALKAICIGVDCNQVYINALIPFCEKYKVQLLGISWDNGMPQVQRLINVKL